MVMKSNNIVLFAILFLSVSSLFTSTEARTLKGDLNHHKAEVVEKGGKLIYGRSEQIIALYGIKNSGPSPGAGHSAVDGVHN
ncbi:hypothetical protein HanIR_Chr15g0744531 [Helianthus annuus]|nr:hypothetical protein HanIR_Chr15g0744531 [Helianthus annuus]